MASSRVRAVALAALVVVALVAGCIGAPSDDDPPIRASAGATTLTDDVRAARATQSPGRRARGST